MRQWLTKALNVPLVLVLLMTAVVAYAAWRDTVQAQTLTSPTVTEYRAPTIYVINMPDEMIGTEPGEAVMLGYALQFRDEGKDGFVLHCAEWTHGVEICGHLVRIPPPLLPDEKLTQQ